MTQTAERLIRNISDTALWVAVYRARENDRPEALFRDPYARKLAGERGEQIAKQMESRVTHEWPYIARTVRFDQILRDQIEDGTDMVVNLAAGLDTRPYRMELPSGLQWVEVDLPAMIDYKEELLRNEKPRCQPASREAGSGGRGDASSIVQGGGSSGEESSHHQRRADCLSQSG